MNNLAGAIFDDGEDSDELNDQSTGYAILDIRKDDKIELLRFNNCIAKIIGDIDAPTGERNAVTKLLLEDLKRHDD